MANTGDLVATEALTHIGKPYVYGAKGPSSFDCSGLTSWCWRVAGGITISPGSQDQWTTGTSVARANLRPGDILCYDTDDNGYTDCSHVGIYVGPGRMVNALNESTGVVVSDPFSPYFLPRYLGARRIAPYTDSAAPTVAVGPATVTGSTPWRGSGSTTVASAQAEFRTVAASLLIPHAADLMAAAGDLGRLMLAISKHEQQHSTYYSVAQAGQYANSHNFLSLASGYVNNAHTWFQYPTFAACVADWRTRLLSTTGPYRNAVTISDLMHVYAPSFENDTQRYIDIVCQIINRNPPATIVTSDVTARTTLGIVVPLSVDLGSGMTAIPSAERAAAIQHVAFVTTRVKAATGIQIDATIVEPSTFTAQMKADKTAGWADLVAINAEFTRVGLADKGARVVLVPDGPDRPPSFLGFMTYIPKNGIVFNHNNNYNGSTSFQFAAGYQGEQGATLTHEWLHAVEQRLRDAAVRVGYGLDVPAVHDGATATGLHRPQYPENVTRRDEWTYLIDLMNAKVPKPNAPGQTYGITDEMWLKIFPSVKAPAPAPTGLVYGKVPLPTISVRDISGSLNTAWDDLGPRKAMFVVLHRMQGTLWGTDSYFRNEARNSARTDYGMDHLNGETLRWTNPLGTMSPWASGPWTAPPGDGLALVAKYGVSTINRDGISIEIAGSYGDPVSATAKDQLARLIAYWADQSLIPWDRWPISPRTGLTFLYWHSEFNGGKDCPGPTVKGYTTQLLEDVRNLLKASQGSGGTATTPALPNPAIPPPTQPPVLVIPPGVTVNQLAGRFGTVTLVGDGGDNPTRTVTYTTDGSISSVWAARGTATGKWPQLSSVVNNRDEFTNISNTGTATVGMKTSLVFQFSDGYRILSDEAGTRGVEAA